MGVLECPGSLAFYGKADRKTAGKRTATCRETRIAAQPGGARPCVAEAQPCSPHHGPWCSPRADRGGLCPSRSVASRTLRFSFLWTLIWAAESSCIRPNFAALLDLRASTSFSLDSTLTFLLKTWFELYKSAMSTQQAKIERNRRKYA